MKNLGKLYKKILGKLGWKCINLQHDTISAIHFYRFGEITIIMNLDDSETINMLKAKNHNLPVDVTMENSVVVMAEMKIHDTYTWDEKIKIVESLLKKNPSDMYSDQKISLSDGFIYYTDIYFQICPDITLSKKQQVKDALDEIHKDFIQINHDIVMAERDIKQPTSH